MGRLPGASSEHSVRPGRRCTRVLDGTLLVQAGPGGHSARWGGDFQGRACARLGSERSFNSHMPSITADTSRRLPRSHPHSPVSFKNAGFAAVLASASGVLANGRLSVLPLTFADSCRLAMSSFLLHSDAAPSRLSGLGFRREEAEDEADKSEGEERKRRGTRYARR